ncbi:unnamed protein product [Peniophora sp. CBMAI 1063]|nr:unnamed protein product [Peniophora sp. CBMAI 1063]
MFRALLGAAVHGGMLAGLIWPMQATGQDFAVPSGWKKTNITLTHAQRLNYSENAARELRANINDNTGYPKDAPLYGLRTISNMLIVLASQDWRSGDVSSRSTVMNTLDLYENNSTALDGRGQNLDTCVFGLAEIAAYDAYGKNESRLEIAKRNFDIVYTDFITTSDAQNGVYTRALSTTCGSNLGGLLFFNHGTTNTDVFAVGIGAWIALAARLYEITGNGTYLDAAEQSIQFMASTHMIDTSNTSALITDVVNASTCAFGTATPPGTANPDDVGFLLEGLSILANVTNGTSGDGFAQMLYELVPAIVTYQPASWDNTTTGILTKDTDPQAPYCSKGIYIRGLLEARLRNPSNDTLVSLIDEYLAIQFNAVITTAYNPGDVYSKSWYQVNEDDTTYNTVAQVDALDVLNAATAISPASTDTAPPNGHSSIGTIIGATVGGTAAVAILAIVVFIHMRRRRRAREMPLRDDRIDTSEKLPAAREGAYLTEPFLLSAPDTVERATLHPEKNGLRQRAALLNHYSDPGADSPHSPSRASPDHAAHLISEGSHPAPAVEESHALSDMERRLESRLFANLMHSFTIRGETESDPPEYGQ